MDRYSSMAFAKVALPEKDKASNPLGAPALSKHIFCTLQTDNYDSFRQLTTLDSRFFHFFLLYLISSRLHIFFDLCFYGFFFFNPFLYCFFQLFFRSAHGTVFTATSTTSCWFHSFLSATCAVFACASTAAPGMRAWQRGIQ